MEFLEFVKVANLGETVGERKKGGKESYLMNGGEQKPVIELTEMIKLS